ncbi:MAG: type II toxin-antitoxin system RelE/ParE family toxin [Pseudomonadota bacterium]
MIEIIQSDTFRQWVARLRDRRARALIAARLLRLASGLAGDTSVIEDGIRELRVHFGPGYRIYFIQEGASIVVLLCGGDKGSQPRDIEAARRLAGEWRRKHD